MKNTKGYTYDPTDNIYFMTTAFAKKARIHGSREFKEILALRHEIPDVKFATKTIGRADNKQTYKGLTCEAMLEYLQCTRPDDDALLDQFYLVKAEAVRQRGHYAFVKKWFLTKCPEYKAIGSPAMNTINDDQNA